MKEERSVARHASLVGIFIMFSRVLGFLRDSINAALFGANFVSDAYFVAFRIPNLLRDLIAEGDFSSVFVSIFSQTMEKEGKKKAWEIANLILNLLVVILVVIVLCGVVFSPLIVKVIYSNPSVPESIPLATILMRVLFPFIAFISLAAFFMGILNSYNEFNIPAIAPCLFNLTMIFGGYFFCRLLGPDKEKEIIGWAIGALLGSLVQFLVQVPKVLNLGFSFRFDMRFNHPAVKKMLKLLVPGVLALSSTQVNIFINTIIAASWLPQGSVTYLTYGNRVMQLPLALFGISISTVILPMLSKSIAQNQMEKVKEVFSGALRLVFFLVIPSAVGICILSFPINSLLFGYGRFTQADVNCTALVSICYSIGLFAYAGKRVIDSAFYALYDTWTPFKIDLWGVGINICLNLVFLRLLGVCGPALFTSVVGISTFTFMLLSLKRKIKVIVIKDLFKAFIKILAASLIMGLGTYLVAYGFEREVEHFNKIYRLLEVFVSISFGIIIYFIMSKLMNLEERHEVYKLFIRKHKKIEEAVERESDSV